MKEKAILIIPAFNEVPDYYKESSFDNVLMAACDAVRRGILHYAFVVDDHSRDFTHIRAREYGIETILSRGALVRNQNRGKLFAAKTGIEKCLGMGADLILMSDADMRNMTAEHIEGILSKIDGNPRVDMAVAPYRQGKELCPYELSGVRALRRQAFLPWFDPRHKDYQKWALFFSLIDEAHAHPMQEKRLNAGYCLEVALEVLVPKYKIEIEDMGLLSRERGGGAHKVNEIAAGVDYGLAVLSALFGEGYESETIRYSRNTVSRLFGN